MADSGQIPGRYNIIVIGEYDRFDRQVPIEEFLRRLTDDNLPDEVAVVGLEEKLDDEDFINNLAREMDQRADDLEYQCPTIQIIVQGSFHRNGRSYDLRYDGDLYSLQVIFGPQLERRDQGNWITSPF